jgi:DNA-binding transcriptional ArsR family regulator
LNVVVMTTAPDLTLTFAALGDPTRRAIVDRLAYGDATVNELAGLFPITLQAVSRHIKVLEAGGLVTRRREGKTRPVHLEPAQLARSRDWLDAHRQRLERKYARLDELLQQGDERS